MPSRIKPSDGGEGDQGHFGDHEYSGKHNKTLASDNIGKRTRRNFGANDGEGPDDIEYRKLLQGKPIIEKEDCKYRVVEAC